MDENVKADAEVTAEQARNIAASAAPRVNRELYRRACREIRASAKIGRHSCWVAIDYAYEQQDALAKKLEDGGFKVNWVTGNGPRTDDGAIMKISW